MQPETRSGDRIALASVPNFRDLGGLPVAGGAVRPGLFLRTQRLTDVNPADLAVLERAGVAAIADFRGVQETAAAPNRLTPVLAARQLALPVEPTASGLLAAAEAEGRASVETSRAVMARVYEGYVEDNAHRFAAFLRLVAEAEGPVVFHCTAGKDRTGFAAALLLAALGADMDVIVGDYLRSNTDWTPPADVAEVLPHRRPLLGVEQAYLQAAFTALARHHGGAEAFAEEAIGSAEALAAFRARAVISAPA